jgi:hypothetical protein
MMSAGLSLSKLRHQASSKHDMALGISPTRVHEQSIIKKQTVHVLVCCLIQ